VPVVFLIAIAVVLVGIFFAATGRGGELAYEQADHAPLDLGPVSAADVALLRPPTAMWGYNMQVTDEALDQIAKAMRERDVTIAYLQEQLATFEHHDPYSESRGAHARQASGALDPPDAPGALDAPGDLDPAGAFDSSSFLETLFPETPGPPTIPDPLEPPTGPAAPEPPTGPAAPETWTGPAAPEASDTVDALEPQSTLEPQNAPETPDASESQDATEPQVVLQPQGTLDSPEPAEPHQDPETHEPSESPEPAAAAESPATAAAATVPVPAPPQTPLVLKASGPKPERHEPTQPSPVLPDPGEDNDTTLPSAATAPDDPPGPQSAFDTHGWWAEQQQAAREEQGRRHAASEQDDESVATAEEQGW